MRTIKFRGKRSDTKEWVYGFYGLSLDDKHYIIEATFDHNGDRCYFFDTEVIPETVGQFTGLTDENGKEIYEGDILQDKNDEDKVAVYWDDEDGFWSPYELPTTKVVCYYPMWTIMKVIGNIHDNPELLEAK